MVYREHCAPSYCTWSRFYGKYYIFKACENVTYSFSVLLLCSIPVCYGTPLGIFRINKEEIGIFNVKFNLLWFLLILWVRQNPNRVYPCFDGMSCHSSVDERGLLFQYYTELSRFHCSYWNDKVYVVNELKILVC